MQKVFLHLECSFEARAPSIRKLPGVVAAQRGCLAANLAGALVPGLGLRVGGKGVRGCMLKQSAAVRQMILQDVVARSLTGG